LILAELRLRHARLFLISLIRTRSEKEFPENRNAHLEERGENTNSNQTGTRREDRKLNEEKGKPTPNKPPNTRGDIPKGAL
jgi:hypothetical protein